MSLQTFFHGSEIATDYAPGAPQVSQLRVDRDLANDIECLDRINGYDDDREQANDHDPVFNGNPGEPLWQIGGRYVNHMGIAAHVYRRTVDELQ